MWRDDQVMAVVGCYILPRTDKPKAPLPENGKIEIGVTVYRISQVLVLAYTFNSSSWEIEAGRPLSTSPAWSTEWAPVKPGLHRESLRKKKLCTLFCPFLYHSTSFDTHYFMKAAQMYRLQMRLWNSCHSVSLTLWVRALSVHAQSNTLLGHTCQWAS